MNSDFQILHKSVLANELIEILNISVGETILDGTINGGGQAEQICKLIGKKGTLIGIDLDKKALKKSEERLKKFSSKKYLVHDNFRNIEEILNNLNIEKVDKMYFDLGLSTDQLEGSERGFSFRREEPLLMTFDENLEDENLTAKDIINTWEEERIADVIFAYGEESMARRIARAIVKEREKEPIKTTSKLADIVEKAVPKNKKRSGLHPARKTFQALRIAVNDELESLKDALRAMENRLSPGGIIALISFHGLEDKIVKNFFKDWQNEGLGKILTKKPISPSNKEIEGNPRASSAKLRAFRKY